MEIKVRIIFVLFIISIIKNNFNTFFHAYNILTVGPVWACRTGPRLLRSPPTSPRGDRYWCGTGRYLRGWWQWYGDYSSPPSTATRAEWQHCLGDYSSPPSTATKGVWIPSGFFPLCCALTANYGRLTSGTNFRAAVTLAGTQRNNRPSNSGLNQ